MSEIPIEINIISGLIVIAWLCDVAVLTARVPAKDELSKRPLKTSGSLGRGSTPPKLYPNSLFSAKNIFGFFGFNQRLAILFKSRTGKG